ncbi:MAG: response regulator [Kangiellaceae bacterium]|nr:response regulator [Kangiellaceae bacterium]
MNNKNITIQKRISKFFARYTLVLLSILSIVGISGAYLYLSNISRQIIEENSISGARRYLEALTEFRTLYTSEVVNTAKQQGIVVSHNYSEIEGAIPLPASLSMALGEKIGQHQSGAKTFLYSRYPFPWREDENKRLFSESFVIDAWQELNSQPEQAYFRFEEYNGRPSIRFAVADIMRPACVNCHNDHPQTPKSDWKEGDVRGVMEVILPVNVAQAASQSTINSTFTILAVMTLLLSVIIGVVFTRRKRDQKKLFLSNRELVKQRTEIQKNNRAISSAHEKLEMHAAELTIALQCKSEFLACMSHEIRTPMNGVIGMLRLLMNTPMNDDQQQKTTLAKNSAESLLTVINDILDSSKIDEGKLELELIEFDLVQLLTDSISSLAVRAEAKNLELILDLSRIEQTMVKGDPGRIRQILTNLVGNSIKFTEHGEIIVSASLKMVSPMKYQFDCTVHDTGIGIPADKQANLFDLFTQVDISTTRVYGGTGLGLSISKRLCELMGGTINLCSELGQGSVFKFIIDLESCKLSKLIKPEKLLIPLSILVVDNNESFLNVIKDQLELWGIEVNCVSNGGACLKIMTQLLPESKYDLVLIAKDMLEMSGEQLVSSIKGDERFSHSRLIMTLLSQSENLNYYKVLGCAEKITKPLGPAALVDVINRNNLTFQDVTLDPISEKIRSKENLPQIENSLARITERKILLVEDNQINQLVVCGILEEFGFQTVDVAENGREAINALKLALNSRPYDLVFMDCRMPVMDGYEASRLIREGAAGKANVNITIIAITANTMKGDKEKCIDAGMSDYIRKPVEPEEIDDKLNKWLKNK